MAGSLRVNTIRTHIQARDTGRTSDQGADTIRTPGRRPRHNIKDRLVRSHRQSFNVLIRTQKPLAPDRAVPLEMPGLFTFHAFASHFTILGNVALLPTNIAFKFLPNIRNFHREPIYNEVAGNGTRTYHSHRTDPVTHLRMVSPVTETHRLNLPIKT